MNEVKMRTGDADVRVGASEGCDVEQERRQTGDVVFSVDVKDVDCDLECGSTVLSSFRHP